ncbi:hypothetical protein NX059_008913 [Plenodomus lindquistii]|nr:hypothetical protein NX059_008913 [Plenodomus lindquistii]
MAIENGTSIPTDHASNTPNQTTTSPPPLPILIAGGGCVGLFLSLLLSHSHPPIPNRIIIIEPAAPDPTATRAMAHQPPTYPLLSQIPGLLEELVEKGSLSRGLCFRKSVGEGSGVIAGKSFNSGKGGGVGGGGGGRGKGMMGMGQLLLPQGKFQEVLLRRLGERGGVEVRMSWGISGFVDGKDGRSVRVSVTSTSTGQTEHIDAAYLVGADGAHSTVRRESGVEFEGETLDAQLVATDLHFDFEAHGFADANFIVDPVHYGLIGRISPLSSSSSSSSSPCNTTNTTPEHETPTPLWRVSYGVPLGLSEHEIQEKVHDKLAAMLPAAGLTPTGNKAYTISRIAPYTPHQRLATTLHPSPHVTLIGDAAHLTNPYAGLGLASGIADAASLAPILARILTGQARDAGVLLDEWSEARRRVFRDVVDGPSRRAYERVRSDVRSQEGVEELVRGDAVVGGLRGGMPVKPGELGTRGEGLEGW